MLEHQPRPLAVSNDFEGTARFKIIRRIGEGGTGYVYLAFDRKRGIEVALKTLRNESPYGILRLKNEFRGLAELAHRNLVNLHDLHQKDGTWFFTMEYVDGEDFLDWVWPNRKSDAETRVDLLRLRDVLEQLVRGLSALHVAGRLHRDIKPSNLLVDRSGRLVILDFGLTTRMDSQDRTDIRGFSGTLEYMAPEQSDGVAPHPASDWYSVGVVLFQALTGRLPFEGKPLQVAMKKRQNDGPAPSTINRQTPVDLDELCVGLLRVDPSKRADELAIIDSLALELDESVSLSDGLMNASDVRVLVGRELELGAMIGALGQVRRGAPAVCMVHGPSGMGKSALVRGFLDPLRGRPDMMVLCGRCYERESVPYKAVDTLIDDLTRRLATIDDAELQTLLPPGIRQLSRLFPVLLNNPSIARMPQDEDAPTDPREARQRGFTALRSLLHNLGHRWTLVIHVDDAHWGDTDSAILLGELLRPPETPRFLLLCSYQSDDRDSSAFLPMFQEYLERAPEQIETRDIRLGPLDRVQARRLAGHLLDEQLTAARYTEQIAVETGGNPYFIEALVRHLREGGSMEPGTLTMELVIGARLERLAPEALQLLRVVCLAGGPIDGDVAFAAADTVVDGPQVLSFLRAEHLVRVRRNGEGETIEPYHERVGETVRSALDESGANELNLSIALALERQSQRSPDRLVEHFLDGGEVERARQYTFESARQADKQLAFDRAAALYERSLSLHRESATLPLSGPACEKEHEILMALAEALENAGRGVQAARIFLEAASRSESRIRLDLNRRAGALLLFSGHIEEGLEVLENVLTQIDVSIPDSVLSTLPGLILRRLKVRFLGHRHDIRTEGAIAEDDLIRADACWSLALGLGLVDHLRAADFQARTLLRSIDCGEPYRMARALAMESAYAAASGQKGWTRARRIAQEAKALAEALDHPHALGMSAYGAGVGHFLNGHWRSAQKYLEDASLVFRERCRGVIWEQATTETFLLSSLAFQGQVEPIARRTPELLEEARQRGNVYFATNLRTGYPAMAWLFADDPKTAEVHHREAMAEWGGDGFHVQHYFDLIAAVHIALYRGEGLDAWNEVTRAWKPMRQSMVHHVKLVDLDTCTLRARAALALLIHEPEHGQARKTLRQDLRKLRKCGVPWAMAQGQLYEGIAFHINGDADAAKSRLATAILNLEKAETPLFALAGRALLGCLIGGGDGLGMLRDSLADLGGRGVLNPIALTNIFCPGASRAIISVGEEHGSG